MKTEIIRHRFNEKGNFRILLGIEFSRISNIKQKEYKYQEYHPYHLGGLTINLIFISLRLTWGNIK